MMSKRTHGLAISYAIDSAFSSEDDDSSTSPITAAPTVRATAKATRAMARAESGAENTAASRRRGRPKDSVTANGRKKSTSPSAKAGADAVLAAKPAGVTKKTATGRKRQVLKEISNAPGTGNAEDPDDFDILSEPMVPTVQRSASPPKRTSRGAKAASAEPPALKPKARRGRAANVVDEDRMEIPETQQEPPVQSRLARTAAAAAKKQPKPAKREVVPETQPERMDVEETEPSPVRLERVEDSAIKVDAVAPKRSSSTTRQRQLAPLHGAVGSASDAEWGGSDSSLRRKVGELTKKLEAMEVKYNGIRDLSVTEAESAFDKLKKQADEKAKAANELIAALRADLKAQSSIAAEAATLKEQLATLTSTNQTLLAEKKSIQTSLQEANNDIKALQAKLAATRSSAAAIQSIDAANSRVPGSAVKPAAQRTMLLGSAEAAKEAQKRVLKEELYSDLTGLIVRDIKRREEEGEEIYDCIQTGRNGTLHFHLTLTTATAATTNAANGAAPSTKQAYEDAEFQYTPLLDANHDRDLVAMLPDYLTEEICFPRSNAAKFYSRVVDCLTKRVEVVMEDDEDEE